MAILLRCLAISRVHCKTKVSVLMKMMRQLNLQMKVAIWTIFRISKGNNKLQVLASSNGGHSNWIINTFTKIHKSYNKTMTQPIICTNKTSSSNNNLVHLCPFKVKVEMEVTGIFLIETWVVSVISRLQRCLIMERRSIPSKGQSCICLKKTHQEELKQVQQQETCNLFNLLKIDITTSVA